MNTCSVKGGCGCVKQIKIPLLIFFILIMLKHDYGVVKKDHAVYAFENYVESELLSDSIKNYSIDYDKDSGMYIVDVENLKDLDNKGTYTINKSGVNKIYNLSNTEKSVKNQELLFKYSMKDYLVDKLFKTKSV